MIACTALSGFAQPAFAGDRASAGSQVAGVRPATAKSASSLPGLGPKTLAAVPQSTSQALVVTGNGVSSATGHAVLYHRVGNGWVADGSWATHNALDGWTHNHHDRDLHTPIGVFSLTDAGGYLPSPGGKLPYYRSKYFTVAGSGFEGEPLAGSFDYVVAINYNRVPGRSPLDETQPLGPAKGGGIWLHVDHGGPTHGCVSLPRAAMIQLLRSLDPAMHPVVVMGDAADLKQ
ncbi:L,D-transpeptidase family protein [Kitasatospora sp. MAP5-34]|uniref:L,D-transpeptidase family protein n=1 Tax=Kitasatospora sp. MAP5-34 TaxID=3035102 RepID=UPI00247593FA|nr:L,D-transpeptidase family protein [Kitasatospora sp. MAP5-34]